MYQMPDRYTHITEDEIKELRSYAELEGTEVEDVVLSFINILEGLGDYVMNKTLLEEMEKELKIQLTYFKEHYVIRNKELIWKEDL